MKVHVLVTGANGFVGQHLVSALVASGCIVDGVGRELTSNPKAREKLNSWQQCDLTDLEAVAKLNLSPYKAIINLAGLANVGNSFKFADLYQRTNVTVIENLCICLLDQRVNPRVLAVSSGAVYDSKQPMPLDEQSKLVQTDSPYAESKIAMETVINKYRVQGLSKCVVVRPFNHFGPGQKEGFIVPDIYKKLKISVLTGLPLKTGNLTTRRDYTDVRDVAQAYTKLAIASERSLSSPVYNVCSGVSRSGQEIVNAFIRQIPQAYKVKIVTDPELLRPSDPPVLIGSHKLLHHDTGWSPKISFEQTIADFINNALL